MAQQQHHGGEQHPEEWRRDLNPDAEKYDYLEDGNEHVAADIKEVYDLFPEMTKAELKQITVVPEGSRLEQGKTYVDLKASYRREFTAMGEMEAGPDNLYVPKSEVDYQTWNRIIGVENPERLGEENE
jgi:hypothetical protein